MATGWPSCRTRPCRRPDRTPLLLIRSSTGLDGPAVLVGHSYGGAVITEAGQHDRGFAALAYITAFAPDKGESVNTLVAGFPSHGPQPPILPPVNGFLFLDRGKFHASFAGDLPAVQAASMAHSQAPWGVDALGGVVSEPAWRSKPSWYLVAADDPHDPAVRPACHVLVGRVGRHRDPGQPRSIRVQTRPPWPLSSPRPPRLLPASRSGSESLGAPGRAVPPGPGGPAGRDAE